jgi:hypothetical protein
MFAVETTSSPEEGSTDSVEVTMGDAEVAVFL